jgi:hypothetical protein
MPIFNQKPFPFNRSGFLCFVEILFILKIVLKRIQGISFKLKSYTIEYKQASV